MRNTSRAFFGFKGIGWGLLLLMFLFALTAVSAEATGSVSGRIWNDINNDGLIDDSEPGVQDVALTLKRADTGETLTVYSDETGAFLFTDLQNDSYTFSVAVPQSMLFARYRKEGGDLRSVLTGENNDATRTYVIRSGGSITDINVGLVDSAIIKGIAYLDLNYNGNYDEGEPPYSGVAVEVIRNASDTTMGRVYTGEDGTFLFNNVRAGNYRLRAILPDDGSTFTLVPDTTGPLSNLFAARAGRRENSVMSIDTENSMVYEYYIGAAIGGTISGTVFNDTDYSGVYERSDKKLSGVTVELVSTNGEIVSQTKSNSRGEYTLTDVMPGEYTLRFIRKDGYTFTKYRPSEEGGNSAQLVQSGDYGETDPFSFSMGESLEGVCAGLVQSATLGGVFFYDENDNGLMDEDEGGFTDGRVRLLSGDGEIDITQTVNTDGSYYFGGVVPTEYTLYYILPEHTELAKVVNGGNTMTHQGLENAITNLTLKANRDYTQPLVGAVKLGTFEGYAFTDLNADGVRDGNETTLAEVAVSIALADALGDAISDTTDDDGYFSITGLRPGEYTLDIALPDGMIFASDIQASSIALEATDAYSSPVTFATLLNRADNAIGAVAPATVQASVWLDENQNSAQDAGERELDDLEFALYDEIHQQYIMTARSDEDGTAVFYNVRPSTYTVSFALPEDAYPVTGSGTFILDAGTMRQTGIVVHAGDSVSGITGGLQCTTSIGGVVLVERTDGRQAVADVEVRLYMEGSTELIQSTLTDTQGIYRFDGLWPGQYVIEVIRPDGYVFIRPNDPAVKAEDSIIALISDEFGTSDSFALAMAADQLDHRVLLTIPAKVGNLVWLDENANGLIDGGEPMINGVTVNLLQDGITIYTTTSNEWGYYEFTDVYPGEYTLEAVAYPELGITMPVPELAIISSCLVFGDGELATSNPFSVTSASVNFFYHLGYILKEGEAMPPEITEGAHQIWPVTTEE